jgi:pimeloyl-ACP methyl ester carboxylesterase
LGPWAKYRRSRGFAAENLEACSSLARRSKQQVHLIGWSFGGYLARELARERADLIGQVITLGTPVIGGPKYTVVAKTFHRRGIDIEAIAAEVEMRNRVTIQYPVIALYSRRDAVVAWQACIDANAQNVEHIEVRTTHFGFGFSPEVYKIIAQRLAASSASEPRPAQREFWRWRGRDSASQALIGLLPQPGFSMDSAFVLWIVAGVLVLAAWRVLSYRLFRGAIDFRRIAARRMGR